MNSSKTVIFDYPLPATAIELLLVLVETAEQYQIQTIACREVQTRDQLIAASVDHPLSPSNDPLGTLQKSGLIERIQKHRVRLHPAAFDRAKYERKSRLSKWWLRTIHRHAA